MIQSLGRALLQPQAAATPRSRSREAHNHAVVASSDAVAAPGRRALLASLAAAAGSLLLPLSPASALTQRSLQSQVRHSIQFGFTCIDQFVRETVLRSRRLGPPPAPPLQTGAQHHHVSKRAGHGRESLLGGYREAGGSPEAVLCALLYADGCCQAVRRRRPPQQGESVRERGTSTTGLDSPPRPPSDKLCWRS